MWEELKVVVEDEVYLASRRTTYRLGGLFGGQAASHSQPLGIDGGKQ